MSEGPRGKRFLIGTLNPMKAGARGRHPASILRHQPTPSRGETFNPRVRRRAPHHPTPLPSGLISADCGRKGNNFDGLKDFGTENGSSKGQNLAMTGFFVPG